MANEEIEVFVLRKKLNGHAYFINIFSVWLNKLTETVFATRWLIPIVIEPRPAL